MLLRRLFSLCLSLFSVLLIVFSAEFTNAAAALIGGRFMTPSEALDVFGSEIQFSYYDGSDYTSSSFLYQGTNTINSTFGDMPDNWTDYSSGTYLEYVATVQTPAVVVNPNYITVDISPRYSIFNTDQITSLIALSTYGSGATISTVYQSPSWDWVIGGNTIHYENSLDNGSGGWSMISFAQRASNKATFVPMQYLGNSLTSGYSLRATFCGNSVGTSSGSGGSRYKYYLWILCPYISSSADGSNGTFTFTSASGGGGDINVNVDIDMSETNSLLQDIKDGLSGIWSGITSVFVPQQSFVQQWRLDMADALGDSFGKYTELDSTLSRVQAAFTQTSGSPVVSFPGVSPPGIGQIIPAFQVSAIPDSLQSFLPHIKFAFNILATMLFVNGMKRKWDEIIHGKIVIETESGVL